ncbi:hypothetical protein OKA04_24120 [Luteolibacter flavescens]|uniref:Uncharacterized protein n=1 Tax=Luteolibacter flavescens TaxID=1859460 RepID=A0ABT3FW94_9BACT|nr:hypothetical protein [Luteolibacter flavescens]MCW1887847.1 hypothetical protein [Luteolibacter flavescens]
MLYIIHDERVQCAVMDPCPIDPASWDRGTILRFDTLVFPLPDSIEHTLLTSMSGVVWHLEILGRTRKRGTGDPDTRIAAKVLRRLQADEDMLVMIRDFCRALPLAAPVHAAHAPHAAQATAHAA